MVDFMFGEGKIQVTLVYLILAESKEFVCGCVEKPKHYVERVHSGQVIKSPR